MQSSLISALERAARLPPSTPLERVARVLREEADYVAAELLKRVEHAPAVERSSEVFVELAERSPRRADGAPDTTRLRALRCRAQSLGLVALDNALESAVARLDELSERAEWLVHGTSPERLALLDPRQDSDRIYHHLLRTFRAEARVVETLAINRVATWESLALFLRSTGEAEHRSAARFFDTYGLFANYFEWGERSERGTRAVERINQIHGRYYLPNDGMKYVLLNSAFTWLDGIERVGHRALSPIERQGFFNAHVRLGHAMHIEALSYDQGEMYAWFREQNRRNAFHTPLKTQTFELFVRNSFPSGSVEPGAMLTAARVAMDEDYRTALGYEEPSASETRSVCSALASLAAGAQRGAGSLYLRSLERSPDRAESKRPAELGVSERSPWLPRVSDAPNGGYPDAQRPVLEPAQARDMPLPTYSWDVIRSHASDESTWIVIDAEVYDVTGWLDQHPGGAARLREWAGRDASAAFREAKHGALTQVLRLNYRIGRVDPGDRA